MDLATSEMMVQNEVPMPDQQEFWQIKEHSDEHNKTWLCGYSGNLFYEPTDHEWTWVILFALPSCAKTSE